MPSGVYVIELAPDGRVRVEISMSAWSARAWADIAAKVIAEVNEAKGASLSQARARAAQWN